MSPESGRGNLYTWQHATALSMWQLIQMTDCGNLYRVGGVDTKTKDISLVHYCCVRGKLKAQHVCMVCHQSPHAHSTVAKSWTPPCFTSQPAAGCPLHATTSQSKGAVPTPAAMDQTYAAQRTRSVTRWNPCGTYAEYAL